nr:gamma-glutamylcyclotransferase [Desulfobulbus elongatus]
MCGQVGIVFGRKRRRPEERDYLREVFIRMLLHSEERGPHASGLAWLKTDGSHRIFKRPMRAHELVYEKPFQELLGQVDNETTILMGHTRWRTRGNEFNNRNNHPIRAGIDIGTHNGTITVLKGNKPLCLRIALRLGARLHRLCRGQREGLARAGGAAHDHAHHPPRGCAGHRKQRIPLHTPGGQRDTARRSKCMNIGEPSKLNTNPEDIPETILRLFVYGTLKRGYWNHQRFCAQTRSIEPAVVWGRLYHLHAGFPALDVPEGLILARGTADPLADARRQQEIGTPRFGCPTGDWDLIHGELVTFTDPQRDLPPIDRLEGFRPGGHSMYQ